MNVLFWGRCGFPISFSAGICQGTFEIVSKEVLWSVRGSYQTIWGPPLPNVTRHSGWWPHTVTPSIDRTLHQFLTITDLDLITEFDFLPNRNVRRDVTALIGWQRSHHWHPVMTRQRRCFYKVQSLIWARIFVVNWKTRNVLGYIKRGYISLPDQYNLNENILTNKEEMISYTENYR